MTTVEELALACLIEKWGAINSVSDEVLGDCAFCVDAKELMILDGGIPNTTSNDFCIYCQSPQSMRDLYIELRRKQRLGEIDYLEALTQFKINIEKLIEDGHL